jgi:hypothetical protein
MRNSYPWRASALTAALLLMGAAGAQPPDQKPEPPRRLVQPAVSVDDMVERIVALDKNKDGKLTRDELPERMHDLIARGDTNKDGALDKDEIKKLATDLPREGAFRGFGPGGRGGPGGGFGPFGGFRPGGGIEGALDGLNLSEKQKDQAEAAVKAHGENVRKLMDLARADLLLKMKEVLSEEAFKNFKAALDRQPGFGVRFIGDGRPPSPAPAPANRQGDLEKKLDQLQRGLDDLRRQIRR